MKKVIFSTVCFALATVMNISHAASATSFTHGAFVSTSQKASGCNTGFCSGGGYVYNSDGGVNTTSAAYTTTDGDAKGSASLSGTAGAPVLKAYAQAPSGASSRGYAQGLQMYQYTGDSTMTLEANASFHSVMSGEGAGLYGAAALIAVDEYTDTYSLEDGFNYAYMDDILLEGFSGTFDLDSDSIFDVSGDQYLDMTLSLVLEPMDTFYLWGEMTAFALSGSSSDAMATGLFSFNTTDVIVLGNISAVPVPAAIWLFSSALFGLFGLRRKFINQAK